MFFFILFDFFCAKNGIILLRKGEEVNFIFYRKGVVFMVKNYKEYRENISQILNQSLDKARKNLKKFMFENDIKQLMENYNFAKEAFLYEMQNHEYEINFQGNFDVLNCFYDIECQQEDYNSEKYFESLDVPEEVKKAYEDAREEYFSNC